MTQTTTCTSKAKETLNDFIDLIRMQQKENSSILGKIEINYSGLRTSLQKYSDASSEDVCDSYRYNDKTFECLINVANKEYNIADVEHGYKKVIVMSGFTAIIGSISTFILYCITYDLESEIVSIKGLLVKDFSGGAIIGYAGYRVERYELEKESFISAANECVTMFAGESELIEV
jgi:hypothetical protein